MQEHELNPFDIGTVWSLFNPTPKPITAKYNGKEFTIAPFTKFDTAHKVVHDHLISDRNMINCGLISYTYTESMRSVYKTEKEFQQAKAIEGLKNLENFLNECVHYENVAVQQNKIQKVPVYLKSNIDSFKKELTSITKLITKYMEKIDEPGTDKNKGEEKN